MGVLHKAFAKGGPRNVRAQAKALAYVELNKNNGARFGLASKILIISNKYISFATVKIFV